MSSCASLPLVCAETEKSALTGRGDFKAAPGISLAFCLILLISGIVVRFQHFVLQLTAELPDQ